MCLKMKSVLEWKDLVEQHKSFAYIQMRLTNLVLIRMINICES